MCEKGKWCELTAFMFSPMGTAESLSHNAHLQTQVCVCVCVCVCVRVGGIYVCVKFCDYLGYVCVLLCMVVLHPRECEGLALERLVHACMTACVCVCVLWYHERLYH